MSRDPIGERGGPNESLFVRNRPTTRFDYLGMFEPWTGVRMYYRKLDGSLGDIEDTVAFNIQTVPIHPTPPEGMPGTSSLSVESFASAGQVADGGFVFKCYKVNVVLKLSVLSTIPSVDQPELLNTGVYGYRNHGFGADGGAYGEAGTAVLNPSGIFEGFGFPREAYIAHERGHGRAYLEVFPQLKTAITTAVEGIPFANTDAMEAAADNAAIETLNLAPNKAKVYDYADEATVSYMNSLPGAYPAWEVGWVPPAGGEKNASVYTELTYEGDAKRVKYTWNFF